MSKSLALVSGLVVLSLAGCSSQLEKSTATGSYKYLKAEQQPKMQVPDELNQPEFSDEYALPTLGQGADKGLVGRDLRIVSPALVHPLVTGSHVQEGSEGAVVTFDQVDDRQPLSQAIWNAVKSFLDKQNVGISQFDEAQNVLVTDWFVLSEEVEDEDSPWYAWSSDIDAEKKRRFKFMLDVKPHGRTASLRTELVEFEQQLGDNTVTEINDFARHREEVDILNEVISHYEYQIQLDNNRRIAEIRQGLQTEMSFNKDGDPAILVKGQYDVVWPRMLLVLRKLGFDVKDLDKSTGLLFVTFNGDDDGWWNNLFSGDSELLDEGDYRLQIARSGNNTTVTFMDDESQPFTAKEVTDLYDPFSEVMTQDNLDI